MIRYFAGWKDVGTLVYSWPQALEKSQADLVQYEAKVVQTEHDLKRA